MCENMEPLLRRLRARLPRKRTTTAVKICFTLLLVAGIVACAILEAYDLTAHGAGIYQASHDAHCWLHLYPYDAEDQEFVFQFGTPSNASSGDNGIVTADSGVSASLEGWSSEPSNWSRTVEVAEFSTHASDMTWSMIRRSESLQARQCEIVLADGVFFSNNTVNNSVTLLPLDFEFCSKAPDDQRTTFSSNDLDMQKGFYLSIGTILTFAALRLCQAWREYFAQPFEANHPISTLDDTKGCCVPYPLDRALRCLTGGHRLRVRNMYKVVVRPYVTFSILSATLLNPFTTIRMHEQCPQLLTQVGDPTLTVVGTCCGAVVVLVMGMLWNKGMCICQLPQGEGWQESGPEDDEYSSAKKRWVANGLCAIITCMIMVLFILYWPYYLAFELRFLFVLNFLEYRISRWAHAVRIMAFVLWLVDTIGAMGKFFGFAPLMQEIRKMSAQGATIHECKEKFPDVSDEQLFEGGYWRELLANIHAQGLSKDDARRKFPQASEEQLKWYPPPLKILGKKEYELDM